MNKYLEFATELNFKNPAHIIICADDYGLLPSISAGIIELLEKRKINATSAMSLLPWWPDEAKKLWGFQARASIGLHLTLTDLQPLTSMSKLAPKGQLPSLSQLLLRAYLHQLPLGEIKTEFDAQLDRFAEYFGRLPDHVDGHQHIHLLPGIREIVIELWKTKLSATTWVRNCQSGLHPIWQRKIARAKSLFIHALGRPFSQALKHYTIPCNQRLSGIYDFKQNYSEVFPHFVENAKDGDLIFCHPGFYEEQLKVYDPIAKQREQELKFLLAMQ